MFPKFPYTDFHRLNADWILEKMKAAEQAVIAAKADVDAAVAIVQGYEEALTTLGQSVSHLAGQVGTVASGLSELAGTVATQADRINSINTGLTDLAGHAVQTYEQEFSEAEKAQARQNIGAVSQADYSSNNNRINVILEYQTNQITNLELSDTAQAGRITTLEAAAQLAVRYVPMTLTNAQKLQARQNIGAAAASDTPGQGALVANVIYDSEIPGWVLDGMTIQEIVDAINNEFSPVTIMAVIDGSDDVLGFTNLRSELITAGSGSSYHMITGYAISNDLIYRLAINSSNSSITFLSEPLRLPIEAHVSGTTPSIAIVSDHFYKCEELTSLTVTGFTTGQWSIVFTSGSTPTVTSFPAGILGLESFAAEANTIYEINVLDNRAVVGSWAVSST